MKKVWLIIAAITLLVGGAIAYVALTSDGGMPYKQNTGNNKQAASGQNGDAQPQANQNGSGQYANYSAQAVANTEGRKWLFFHAPWCPQCRALEADIQNDGVPAGLTIFKVDYDSSTELKQKYGVTLQTTVVEIDDQGNEVKKFVAYDDPSLDAVLGALGR